MKRVTLLSLLFFLIASWGFAQADLQTAAIVKLTKNEPITVRQWRTEVERQRQVITLRLYQKLGRAPTEEEVRRDVLDIMINERLVIQAAERDSLAVFNKSFATITRDLENDINGQINQIRAQLALETGKPQLTEAEFAARFKSKTGLDVTAYKEQLQREVNGQIGHQYIMAKIEKQLNSVKPPTEPEIITWYNRNKAQLVRPETVEYTAIQILFGPDAASRTRARQLGDRLIREIGSNPSKFDDAVENAKLPNSGYSAARDIILPMIPEAEEQYGNSFIDQVFSLKQGQISGLLETSKEYFIIKVTRNLELKFLKLEDDIPVYMLPRFGIDPRSRATATVRYSITNLLTTERKLVIYNQASEELVNELRANGKSFEIRNVTW